MPLLCVAWWLVRSTRLVVPLVHANVPALLVCPFDAVMS